MEEKELQSSEPTPINRSEWALLGEIDLYLQKKFGFKIKTQSALDQIEKARIANRFDIHTVDELFEKIKKTNERQWERSPLFFSAIIKEISKRRVLVKD